MRGVYQSCECLQGEGSESWCCNGKSLDPQCVFFGLSDGVRRRWWVRRILKSIWC